jgi:2-polyprenyl-3-methyl-5-hydroxy-6-metoxy-1,4-benzoquinol methylase
MSKDWIQVQKNLWDGIAQKAKTPLAAATARYNPHKAEVNDRIEKHQLKTMLHIKPSWTVLDLGAGSGRYTTYFAKQCEEVCAVELSPEMFKLLKQETASFSNVHLHNTAVEQFTTPQTFDLIIVSGLLQYVQEKKVNVFIDKLESFCHKGTILLLRDHTIKKEKQVQDYCFYRTKKQLLELFKQYNLLHTKPALPFNIGIFLYEKYKNPLTWSFMRLSCNYYYNLLLLKTSFLFKWVYKWRNLPQTQLFIWRYKG